MHIPTFGYRKGEEPRIFHLKDGEALPAGWHDSPVKAEQTIEPAQPQANKRQKISE